MVVIMEFFNEAFSAALYLTNKCHLVIRFVFFHHVILVIGTIATHSTNFTLNCFVYQHVLHEVFLVFQDLPAVWEWALDCSRDFLIYSTMNCSYVCRHGVSL